MNKYALQTFALIFILFLCGCSSYQEFYKEPNRYTSMLVGDIYVLQQDMILIKYNYLLIPLIKPGVQLIPASSFDESEMAKGVSILGRAKKGNFLKITGYQNEGGWMPHHGDMYKVNPMATMTSGELKGKKLGISFLCDDNTEILPFRTGHIYFAKPDFTLIQKPIKI